jgi:micrococcal nuclease
VGKSVRAQLRNASSRAPQTPGPFGGGDQHIRQPRHSRHSAHYSAAWSDWLRAYRTLARHDSIDDEQTIGRARSRRSDRRRSPGRHGSPGQTRSIHVQRGGRGRALRRARRRTGTALVGLVLIALAGCSPAATYTAIDGDTLKSRDDGQRVRIIGIDTPEISHGPDEPTDCFADEAHQRLRSLIEPGQIELVDDSAAGSRDKYGRDLAYVEVDGVDVGAALLREGFARAVDYGHDHARRSEYASLESTAQVEQKGMWGEC